MRNVDRPGFGMTILVGTVLLAAFVGFGMVFIPVASCRSCHGDGFEFGVHDMGSRYCPSCKGDGKVPLWTFWMLKKRP